MFLCLFFVNVLLKNVNLCLFFELFWFIDGVYRHKWPLEEIKTKKSSAYPQLDEDMRQDSVSFAVYALKLSQTYG